MTTKVHCYIYKISETEKGILLLGSVRLWKDFSHSDLIVMAVSVGKKVTSYYLELIGQSDMDFSHIVTYTITRCLD